jgi:hypothetical protein
MTRLLVVQNFRYVNGQVADDEDILVVARGTLTPAALYSAAFGGVALVNPIIADDQGNVSFYIDAGSYDYMVNGARIPFDAFEVTGGGTGFYTQHDQSVPIATWVILHAFGRLPNVTIIDDQNQMILTDLEYPDTATVVATFPAPTTGKAILQA